MKKFLWATVASTFLSLVAPQAQALWWYGSKFEAVEACREWKHKKGVFTVYRKTETPEIPFWKRKDATEREKLFAEIMEEAEAMYPDGLPSFDGLEADRRKRKEGVINQFDVAICYTEDETKQVLGYAYLVKSGSHWPDDLESLPHGGQRPLGQRFRW